MKVVCTLDIGNDATYPDTKVTLEGDPLAKGGFVHLRIGDDLYEVRPQELAAALQRVRSDS